MAFFANTFTAQRDDLTADAPNNGRIKANATLARSVQVASDLIIREIYPNLALLWEKWTLNFFIPAI